MKLQPVYLVSPEMDVGPDAADRAHTADAADAADATTAGPRATRRGFLLFGLCGLVVGGSFGFVVGREAAAGGRSGPASAEQPRRPNAHLEWARALADGPIAPLYENATGFLVQLNRAPDDPVLWRGVRRLSTHVIENPDLRKRSLTAANLVDFLERLEPAGTTADARDFDRLLAALRSIDGR